MLINQSFVLIFYDQAEIIEAGDLPFDPFSCDEFNDYDYPLLAHSVEKLILNINVISNHNSPPYPLMAVLTVLDLDLPRVKNRSAISMIRLLPPR